MNDNIISALFFLLTWQLGKKKITLVDIAQKKNPTQWKDFFSLE